MRQKSPGSTEGGCNQGLRKFRHDALPYIHTKMPPLTLTWELRTAALAGMIPRDNDAFGFRLSALGSHPWRTRDLVISVEIAHIWRKYQL
jgi:hypothetical protein